MPKNQKSLRVASHKKLDTRPRWLGMNKMSRSLFRNRAYVYNTLPSSLTTLPDVKKIQEKVEGIFEKKLKLTHPNGSIDYFQK